jgi:hypothetical protein
MRKFFSLSNLVSQRLVDNSDFSELVSKQLVPDPETMFEIFKFDALSAYSQNPETILLRQAWATVHPQSKFWSSVPLKDIEENIFILKESKLRVKKAEAKLNNVIAYPLPKLPTPLTNISFREIIVEKVKSLKDTAGTKI